MLLAGSMCRCPGFRRVGDRAVTSDRRAQTSKTVSDQNRVPYQRKPSRIRRRATAWLMACCLAFAACTDDDAAGRAPEVELRERLSDNDLAAEVIDCVLQLAADELRRGPLDPVMEEELVASCERAQDVLGRSDAEFGGSGTGESSGGGLAFSDDLPGDQPLDYGDDPALDRLWDGCKAGDGEACDRLFEQSPVASRYEEFGLTCGNRDQVLDCRELDSEADSP